MRKLLAYVVALAMVFAFIPSVFLTANADDTGLDVYVKGSDIYMQGYPTTIEKKVGGGDYDLTITYIKGGQTESFDYIGTVPAVIYGGTKDVDGGSDLNETSITLKSGTVSALIGGSKHKSGLGSVKKAVINIEGGNVVSSSTSPSGVVTAAWYWGPDVDEFEVNMTGGSVQEIYGGSTTSTSAKNTAITVGKFTANVSGGTVTNLWGGASSQTGALQMQFRQ